MPRAMPLLSRLLLAGVVGASLLGWQARTQAAERPPNILFIILDDVGEDMLASFNAAASNAAWTPILNAIVAAGVKFTNFYTMPECSPSRAAFFTGRYPLRNGVNAAILDQDLPAAQVSPFEVTTPRLLETAGYASALIGKYHLGGPENNPDGNRAPVALGWSYFNGNLRGGPPSIDVSLGGQYTRDSTKFSCGFPTGTRRGAGWFQGPDKKAQCDDHTRSGYTGQEVVAMGGIAALDAAGDHALTCREAAGAGPDFTKMNGYYVWPQATVDFRGAQTPQSRQYMTTAQTDAAIDWIRSQSQAPDRHPWMATVSYNAVHTPFQQPSLDLYPPGFVWPPTIPEDCANPSAQRLLSQLMLAAMDREIGRLLVEIGLADIGDRGQLIYRPEFTDTMVVIAGDNGTFIPIVQSPYDPIRSKGTPYETGVKAPLIVSGPLVVSPGRSVEHLVNSVDLFQLFGEIAGVNVRTVVPASHVLDAQPVLPYLMNPAQPSVRRFSFTQLGTGLKPASVKLWPCVIRVGPVNIASDTLFTAQNVCEESAGVWYGPTASQPVPTYSTSCAVKQAGLYSGLILLPVRVWALRDRQFKLVKSERASCETNLGEYEFYDLSVRSPSNPLGLDLTAADLLTNGQPVGLTSAQMASFLELQGSLQALLNSEPVCRGDGNLDKTVNTEDLSGLLRYWGQPSVFDFNKDGVTNLLDLPDISNNFGSVCR